MISWPVTVDGILTPARNKLNQYEFQCRNSKAINTALPLVSGNPYTVTVSKILGKRNKGIQITCKFNNNAVDAQFHRGKKIWISSNGTIGGPPATAAWNSFISLFGIAAGKTNKIIPVYLDFYPNLVIVVGYSTNPVPKSSYV